MKNRNTIFTAILLASAYFALCPNALLPVAQAKQPSEDRGNGNSAAENVDALNLSTTGSNNTAHGWFSLFSNTTGGYNTADGFQALYSNTAGVSNTANGIQALFSNTIGNGNTATGNIALFSNTEGEGNTATGNAALDHNTVGDFNTATGTQALFLNTTGNFNVATGYNALNSNTEGEFNTATGSSALFGNTTGFGNVAIGHESLINNISGSLNTCVGYLTGGNIVAGGQNIYIGVATGGPTDESFTIRIADSLPAANGTTSKVFIGGIVSESVGVTGQTVLVNGNGQLGTAVSSVRFKKDIDPMGETSETIFSLEPVTFHYKGDTTNMPQFGLIAEQVAKVNPALVLPGKDGKPHTVRYEQINAMLLNEFLKEHRKVEQQQLRINDLEANAVKQEVTISELTKDMGVLSAQLTDQAAQIQNVGARLEVSRPLTRVALSNP